MCKAGKPPSQLCFKGELKEQLIYQSNKERACDRVTEFKQRVLVDDLWRPGLMIEMMLQNWTS